MTTTPVTTTTSAAAATAASATSAAASPPTSLDSLGSDMTDFLKLLMVQLQNQDPSSPMDTSTFTNQLVQYASVEQQIDANTNLKTLIQASQSDMILQSSSLVGKQAVVTNSDLALQSGAAQVGFTAPKAETVNIKVQAADGSTLLQTTMNAQAGQNNWSWNGIDGAGTQQPDGAYKVTVTDPSQNAITTTTTGTITGVSRSGTSVQVSLGTLDSDVSTIQSVANQ